MNNSIERLRKDFEEIAKEPLSVEKIAGGYFAFGSELATLRLYKKLAPCANSLGVFNDKTVFGSGYHISQGYTENSERFYFLYDPQTPEGSS